jgi:hypothetical protein
MKVDGSYIQAHRIAWMLSNQHPIPDGMVVMHRCDNPRCCRPDHLLVGTQAENIADRVAKGRSARGRAPAKQPAGGRFGPTSPMSAPVFSDFTPAALREFYEQNSVTQQALA